MTEMQHLSEALLSFTSDPKNNWFKPITESIQGLSAEQAAIVPAKGFNSVWAVVNHVWFCQSHVLLRLQGQPAGQFSFGEGNDWPPVGDPMDESAWQTACERMLAVTRELAQCIGELTEKELETPFDPDRAERWKWIQGVIAHNGYHACEVISIRHMQGQWLKEV